MENSSNNANKRSRNWCFTLNNPTETESEEIHGMLREPSRLQFNVRFGIIGNEVGAMGTPHFQGFLVFTNPVRMATVKNLPGMHRAHIESARGSIQQNVVYCSKSGNVQEYGELPSQGTRTDLARVATLVTEGKTLSEISDACPTEFIKFHKGIERLMQLRMPYRNWKTEVLWFYGPTGTGKSKTAWEIAELDGSYYAKDPTSKWWCGYVGQNVVIIDDYRKDFCTFASLLRLFDRYPLPIEVKGGTTQFLARKIILTTPKDPLETWDGRTSEDLAQLTRRITEIRHFSNTIFNPSL